MKHLLWKLSPDPTLGIPQAHRRALEQDGILILPDYYPQDVFSKIEEECRLAEKVDLIKTERNKNNTHVDWHHGNIPCDDGRFPTLRTMVQRNRSILKLVSFATRRRILYYPQVIYQRLTLPKGEADNVDVEQVIHADRHYQTVKVLLLLEDVAEENSPFMYSPGSHKINRIRLEHEKSMGYREALRKAGRSASIPSFLLERGRNTPSLEERKAWPLRPILGKKNTLVVINTGGFHSRGAFQPGKSRTCLRMIFHYVHAPYLFQHLMAFLHIDPALYLN